MAERQKRADHGDTEGSGDAERGDAENAAASRKTTATNPSSEDARWVEGQWNGLPMWTCGVCQWDTLEGEGAMVEHIRAQHEPPPAPPPAPVIQVFDRWGNPVPPRTA